MAYFKTVWRSAVMVVLCSNSALKSLAPFDDPYPSSVVRKSLYATEVVWHLMQLSDDVSSQDQRWIHAYAFLGGMFALSEVLSECNKSEDIKLDDRDYIRSFISRLIESYKVRDTYSEPAVSLLQERLLQQCKLFCEPMSERP